MLSKIPLYSLWLAMIQLPLLIWRLNLNRLLKKHSVGAQSTSYLQVIKRVLTVLYQTSEITFKKITSHNLQIAITTLTLSEVVCCLRIKIRCPTSIETTPSYGMPFKPQCSLKKATRKRYPPDRARGITQMSEIKMMTMSFSEMWMISRYTKLKRSIWLLQREKSKNQVPQQLRSSLQFPNKKRWS